MSDDDTATPAEIALVLAYSEGLKATDPALYAALWRVCRGADHWYAQREEQGQ